MMYNGNMNKKAGGYEINEKDIEATIRFLKTIDSEHATPEMAITILEHYQAEFHLLGHADPEKLVEILNNLKKDRELFKKFEKLKP